MHRRSHVASGRALLATQVVGQGHPVVFLHANVCDSRMLRAQLEAVGIGNMAIAYDRRGFGETRFEKEDFSPVADLMAVMDAMATGKPVILVGCSRGGKIAIDAALLHPSRIVGLVLVAPSVGGAPKPVYSPAIKEMLAQQKAAEDAGELDQVNAIKARLWLDGPLAPEGRVTGQARQLFLDMNGIALRSPPAGSSLDVTPAFSRLAEIGVPSLVVWGDLDFPHIQDRSRHIAKEMPNATGCELAGTAHLPSLEQPAAVTGLLLSFMERLLGRHSPLA
ncbi:MAG: Alpha/beta hydrolase [Rubritepida sp.]|nr:Alpha/beta hydrolase [Rubritepida sp.]